MDLAIARKDYLQRMQLKIEDPEQRENIKAVVLDLTRQGFKFPNSTEVLNLVSPMYQRIVTEPYLNLEDWEGEVLDEIGTGFAKLIQMCLVAEQM